MKLILGNGEKKILDALNNAKPEGGLKNQHLLRLAGMYPANLAKFLKRLQAGPQPMIRRDPQTRKYQILEPGEQTLGVTDHITLISRTKRVYSRRLEPNNEAVAPRILPVQASMYLNE